MTADEPRLDAASQARMQQTARLLRGIYAIVERLEALHPGRSFKPDGHMVGARKPARCLSTTTGLALVLLPMVGCSWVFVRKAPQGPLQPAPPLACTSNVAAPVADTVGAVLFGVSGGMVAVAGLGVTRECEPWCAAEKGVLIATGLLGVGAATVLAFSAGHGYSTTAECRDLREAQLSCSAGVEASCLTLSERRMR